MQDLVVRHEVDFEIVPQPFPPSGLPWFEVCREAVAGEAERVRADDQFAGAGARDEPAFERHAVGRGESDIVELEASVRGRPQQWRSRRKSKAARKCVECGVDLCIKSAVADRLVVPRHANLQRWLQKD
ncbi:hypothetical protein CUT44_25900 [Streptomyces carminius]|uniref:Uncharacterized protein n=1 Tax=Streptomyces carminius TaxID=2665496 RepID=A0A2M8LSZ7_9ACTN|nr:hypothetical protein CUT44_25900 [Streptomyces carminius]